MTQQEKEILNQYASAKIDEKRAKETINALRDEVDKIVLNNTTGEKGDKVIIESGKFSVSFRRKYVYPEHVLQQEEYLKQKIKELKEDSERIGDGTYDEVLSLTFKEEHGHETEKNN